MDASPRDRDADYAAWLDEAEAVIDAYWKAAVRQRQIAQLRALWVLTPADAALLKLLRISGA